MANPPNNEIFDRINALSHQTTAGFITEAKKLQSEGYPVTVATSIVVDAALMAAASFLQTALMTGAVRLTMPADELLRVRLAETLSLPTRIFPLNPDGTFDPAGQKLN